jgi:hypothetical protein
VDRYKDIKIGDHEYRIKKLPAKTALWIAMQFFTKMMPPQIEAKIGIGKLSSDRKEMTEEEFSSLIDYCLMAAERYESMSSGKMPIPVIHRKGVFAIPELEDDFITVVSLTIHVIVFNISAFFNGEGMEILTSSLKDLDLSHTLQK